MTARLPKLKKQNEHSKLSQVFLRKLFLFSDILGETQGSRIVLIIGEMRTAYDMAADKVSHDLMMNC